MTMLSLRLLIVILDVPVVLINLQESDFLFLTITKQTTNVVTTIPPDKTAVTIPALHQINVFSHIDFVYSQ